jgi:diaminopimelate epimerase
MTSIPFFKMSGAGNDFILIDNRNGIVPEDNLPLFAANVCRRKLSAGGDGLILLEDAPSADFKWRFYNSDGSIAEMCGNGARCAARFAFLNGIAEKQMRFETVAGVIHARILDECVKVKMTDPHSLSLGVEINVQGKAIRCGSVNTGVPHVVVGVDDIETVDVVTIGKAVRFHERFAPAGTNVNFVAMDTDGMWTARTYERGVEDETLACGTGMAAVAIVLAAQSASDSPISLKTRSGSSLKIHFTQAGEAFSDIFLEGDARIIYEGRLNPEAWQY